MEIFRLNFVFLYLFAAAGVSACASTPNPPEVVTIQFLSIEKGIVQETIIGTNFSQDYDVPGYKIKFESDQEIAPKAKFPKQNPFVSLEYYDCESAQRYAQGHAHSARDYVMFEHSPATFIEAKPNGKFLYEAQLIEGGRSKDKENICAKIFVFDGNSRRKVWRPIFVSNEIKFSIPQ